MKKNVLKAMLYLLCSGLIISPMVAKDSAPRKAKPGTAIFVMCETPCIIPVTKHIFKDTPTLYLDIKIPQLHGFSHKKFEHQLNKSFLEIGQTKAANAIKNANLYNKPNLNENVPPLKFEYLSDYTVIDTIDPYFVIEILDYEYNGGAHGLSTQTYFTIDTLQNTIVTLDTLFRPESDYMGVINREITRQIQERTAQGEYFFTGTDGFSGIKTTQPFYINKTGDLVIVFNVYEIAPYAAGAVEFVIPRTLLEDNLK